MLWIICTSIALSSFFHVFHVPYFSNLCTYLQWLSLFRCYSKIYHNTFLCSFDLTANFSVRLLLNNECCYQICFSLDADIGLKKCNISNQEILKFSNITSVIYYTLTVEKLDSTTAIQRQPVVKLVFLILKFSWWNLSICSFFAFEMSFLPINIYRNFT